MVDGMRGLVITGLLQLLPGALAFSFYSTRIPNGDTVVRNGQAWPGVGHFSSFGGDARNQFGVDFELAGNQWTPALCRTDSDFDGQSNGLELGDPDCVWTPFSVPARITDISHPGFSDSITSALEESPTLAPVAPAPAPVAPAPAPVAPTPAPDEVPACVPSKLAIAQGPDLYACKYDIAPEASLHWRIVGSDLVHLALVKSGAEGWLALGFPATAGRMVPSEAFVASSNGGVEAWHLGGYSENDITPHDQSAIPIQHSKSSASVEGGALVLRLEDVVVADVQNVELLFAREASSSFPSYHGSQPGNRMGLSIDLLTGGVANILSNRGKVRAHGILQLLAWIVLAPLAVLIKRLGARSPRLQSMKVAGFPFAFIAHATMMGMAVLLCVVAVTLAWVDFPGRAKYGHGVVGLLVSICAMVQPLPALFCRPDPQKQPDRRRIFNLGHRGLGMATLFLAIVCIFLGIYNYRELWDANEATIFGITAVGGLLCVFVLFCGVDCRANVAKCVLKRRAQGCQQGTDVESPQLIGMPAEACARQVSSEVVAKGASQAESSIWSVGSGSDVDCFGLSTHITKIKADWWDTRPTIAVAAAAEAAREQDAMGMNIPKLTLPSTATPQPPGPVGPSAWRLRAQSLQAPAMPAVAASSASEAAPTERSSHRTGDGLMGCVQQ